MAQEFFRYETPYGRPRQRVNYFVWTVVILLLTGFAFAAWLASFYIFWQPERPDSYRLLRKLHRIDPPRRFELSSRLPDGMQKIEVPEEFQAIDELLMVGSRAAKTKTDAAANISLPNAVNRFPPLRPIRSDGRQ